MTLQLLLQAFLAPILIVAVATAARRYWPLVVLAGYWTVSLWIKGLTIEAMDSVALVMSVAVLVVLIGHRQRAATRLRLLLLQLTLLVLLSVWQVKNFAADITPQAWFLQALYLLAIWWFSSAAFRHADVRGPQTRKYDPLELYWLIPIAYVAVLSPIAGSLMIGQIAGLVTLLGVLIWLAQRWLHTASGELPLLLVTPGLFVAQMAWHYAEIPWTSLSLGLLGWLPMAWPGLRRQPYWVQLIIGIAGFTALLAVGLYLEWPEQSLY